jgi:hypothetical protein
MKRKFSIVPFILSITVFFALTCTTGNSPYQREDATINVIMENASGQRDADTITDTVGKTVRIGMIGYLSSYITSARVIIGTNSNADTTLSYAKVTAWSDTQWIVIGFRSVGARTATVSVYIGTEEKTVTASIVILGKSVRISNQPKSLSVDPNGSALFFVTIQDTGTFRYQWVKDGSPVSGATTDSLLIDTVHAADVGVYTCVVKDRWNDSVVSYPAVLTIKPVTTSNHKPQLSVSGVQTVVSAQACTLSLSVTDTDNGQTHTYAMIKSPAGATLSGNIFSWSSPATFVGTDSAIFTVTDNGSPALSDTQTAYLTVSSQSSKTPPTLVSPTNGAWGQPVSTTLVWNKVTGVSEYYLQVASDSGFVNMFLSDSTQTDTAKVIVGCTNGTTYYWRVNAKSVTTSGSVWSSVWKFSTKRQFALMVAAANGTITKTPNATEYDSGTVVGLKAIPNTGYHFVNWSGDVSDTTDDSATITINKARNVTAVFAINTYTISATAGPNGAIFPSGNTTVNYNTSKTFSITPSLGYQIADVLVDGVSAGAVASYTFDNVSASHSINATFTTAMFTITTTNGTGGTISPDGVTTVLYNASKSYSITPISGYEILDVLVDGKSVGAVSSHDFINITSNHTIYATFGLVGPVQVGPVDGAVNVSNSTTRFSWNVYPGGAASYQLEVSDSSNFGRLLINTTVPGTNFTSGGVLSGATTYYWRINATLTNGIKTDWSPTWSFTTW